MAGQSVTIEYRFAEGRYERIPEFAAELVRQRVDVICTVNNAGALAAKAATAVIPIVFVVGVDPVAVGLVSQLGRPGGNATGVSFLATALEPKRLELLRELAPDRTLVAALVNPDNPNARQHEIDLQSAARNLALRLLILSARSSKDIETTFSSLSPQDAVALLVTIDPFFLSQRELVIERVRQSSIPAVYPLRDFVDDGGLVSYGNNLSDAAEEVGVYAGRILLGVRPADLPVVQPTKFELVLNMKTARHLHLTIPESILARADEVIE